MNFKANLVILFFSLLGIQLLGQTGNVGIGTTSPDGSAKLDVNASDKGVLLPQVDIQSSNDALTITSPAKSLLVWNTGETWGDSSYYYNDGTTTAPVWSKLQSNETGIAKFYNNTSQSSISSGTNVTLNTTEANSMTSYVSLSGGIITLEPGTYELNGSVGGMIPISGGNAIVWHGFYNLTTSSYIGQGGTTASGNSGNHNGGPHNTANVVITITSTSEIVLKVNRHTSVSSISADADFINGSLGRAWVSIRKYN